MNKPREFWIEDRLHMGEHECVRTNVWSYRPGGTCPDYDTFKVIEYSAYEQQRAVIEKLEAELQQFYRMAASGVWVESNIYAKQVEDKAKLVETLKWYAQFYVSDINGNDLPEERGSGTKARKTLAEMDEK